MVCTLGGPERTVDFPYREGTDYSDEDASNFYEIETRVWRSVFLRSRRVRRKEVRQWVPSIQTFISVWERTGPSSFTSKTNEFFNLGVVFWVYSSKIPPLIVRSGNSPSLELWWGHLVFPVFVGTRSFVNTTRVLIVSRPRSTSKSREDSTLVPRSETIGLKLVSNLHRRSTTPVLEPDPCKEVSSVGVSLDDRLPGEGRRPSHSGSKDSPLCHHVVSQVVARNKI